MMARYCFWQTMWLWPRLLFFVPVVLCALSHVFLSCFDAVVFRLGKEYRFLMCTFGSLQAVVEVSERDFVLIILYRMRMSPTLQEQCSLTSFLSHKH